MPSSAIVGMRSLEESVPAQAAPGRDQPRTVALDLAQGEIQPTPPPVDAETLSSHTMTNATSTAKRARSQTKHPEENKAAALRLCRLLSNISLDRLIVVVVAMF